MYGRPAAADRGGYKLADVRLAKSTYTDYRNEHVYSFVLEPEARRGSPSPNSPLRLHLRHAPPGPAPALPPALAR